MVLSHTVLYLVIANFCPPTIPALSLSFQPSQSSPAPSLLNHSKLGHTQFFVPRHRWRMNGCFVLGCTKPLYQDSSGQWGLGRKLGIYNPILPGWLTDSNYMQVTGKQQSSGWNPWPWAAQEEERLLPQWAAPRGFTVQCLCYQP